MFDKVINDETINVSIYDEEVMKIQEGEKRGEKRGEISPLHLNIIFGSFTLITMKKFRQNIYTHYDEEVLTKHIR